MTGYRVQKKFRDYIAFLGSIYHGRPAKSFTRMIISKIASEEIVKKQELVELAKKAKRQNVLRQILTALKHNGLIYYKPRTRKCHVFSIPALLFLQRTKRLEKKLENKGVPEDEREEVKELLECINDKNNTNTECKGIPIKKLKIIKNFVDSSIISLQHITDIMNIPRETLKELLQECYIIYLLLENNLLFKNMGYPAKLIDDYMNCFYTLGRILYEYTSFLLKIIAGFAYTYVFYAAGSQKEHKEYVKKYISELRHGSKIIKHIKNVKPQDREILMLESKTLEKIAEYLEHLLSLQSKAGILTYMEKYIQYWENEKIGKLKMNYYKNIVGRFLYETYKTFLLNYFS
ncbi:MAG: hypothetical protein GXO43_01815 [Crenarchaeota archaeon]|nr:hypothetical protein [Thermoproteota archaeon]